MSKLAMPRRSNMDTPARDQYRRTARWAALLAGAVLAVVWALLLWGAR